MPSSNLARAVDEPFRRAIAPDPDLFAWQWAEQHRELPPDTPEPGPKSYDRTPYLRAISEALSPQSPYEHIIFQKGAQIGGTDLGADWHGHTIHLAPSTVLIVWPSVEFAQRKSRELFDPLIDSTPVLRKLVAPPRSKDSQNTILVKRFVGGRLVMVGANSGIGLRSTAAQKVHLDEVDAFTQIAGKEGDPVRLALRATRTFKGRRKIYMVSTPLLESTSMIAREFGRASRACDFHLPCPHCGHFQALVWDRMRYEVVGEGERVSVKDTRYLCSACDAPIYNHDKAEMLAKGRWVDRWNTGAESSIAFHLSALYSPVGWFSWDEAALDYIRSKGRPSEEQIWVNTVLGLPYSEPSEAPSWEPLYARREDYAEGVVQPGVALVTMAIDVQADRLEVEVKGWGREGRSWSLLYRTLVGDPLDDPVWEEADAILATEWPTVGGDGKLPIWCCAVDSGSFPQRVYRWARKHRPPSFGNGAIAVRSPQTVMVVKGRDVWGRILLTPQKTSQEEKKRGLKVVSVGVSGLKRDLYRHLRQMVSVEDPDPPGCCHWPATDAYDERFFRGLVAERLMVKGTKEVWELPPGVRNEPLDLQNYNRAAAAACGIDRLTEPDWERLEARLPKSLVRVRSGLGEEREARKPLPPSTPEEDREPRTDALSVAQADETDHNRTGVESQGPPPAAPTPKTSPQWKPPVVSTWARRTRLTGGGGW